ncbi:hypothetical protein OJAV_G00092570 [Oryzias javanicus]|uniref:Uncharacterized protein n=1 Tax=Oryzias javanicus TaxID=123683 RepID=A0A437D165_ORYJA|nr:hypothetical protein OJAV_G00092570 [Oryzias javanicus]
MQKRLPRILGTHTETQVLIIVLRHRNGVTQCTMEVDHRICNDSFKNPSLSVVQRRKSSNSHPWQLHNSKQQLPTLNPL